MENPLSFTNKQTWPLNIILHYFWIKVITYLIQLQKSRSNILALTSPQSINKIILEQETLSSQHLTQSEFSTMKRTVFHKMQNSTNSLPKARWPFTGILNSFRERISSIFLVLSQKDLWENIRWETRYHLKCLQKQARKNSERIVSSRLKLKSKTHWAHLNQVVEKRLLRTKNNC